MPEEYVHQDYPKMMYHEDGRPPVIVDSAEEEKALGSGWYASPAEYGVETAPAAPPGAVAGGVGIQGFARAPRPQAQPAPSGAGTESTPPLSRRRE